MDVSEAKDRMLEVENLTDALEDDDANWLLDWGIDKVGPLIQGIADDDQAGDKVNQLMGVMRSVNRTTGDRNAAPPDELADDVRQLVDKYNAAFGASVSLSDEQVTALVGRIGTLGERDTMQALLEAVTQPGGATPAASAPPTSAPQATPVATPATSDAANAPSADVPKATEAAPGAPNLASAPGQGAAPSGTTQQSTSPTSQPEADKQGSQQASQQTDQKTDASGQEESHA